MDPTSSFVRRGRFHGDDGNEEEQDRDRRVRPRRLALAGEEEGEEPDTEPEEMEAPAAAAAPAVAIARRRMAASNDDGEWRNDPVMRWLQERGLPTRMPFGRYAGRSLREMWESTEGECVE